MRAFVCAVALLTCSWAMRRNRETSEKSFDPPCPDPQPGSGEIGEPGRVDFLYTFGAPGAASPGLQNQQGDSGIFPGLRTWQRAGEYVDMVAAVTSAIWMWHPWQDAESIEIDNPIESWDGALGLLTAEEPSTLKVLWPIHLQPSYMKVVTQRGCERWTSFANFTNGISYQLTPGTAALMAADFGWAIGGAAFDDADNTVIAGMQASYLIQNPNTLECALTFQGSSSLRDWYANVAFRVVHFCGLVEEDEECSFLAFSPCAVRRPRGSFVHFGFADKLRQMVKTPTYREGIQPNLGKCSAVYVTGHSLGGAMASLFTACASRQLKPSEYGYEDYKYIGWTKQTPERLEYVNPW